MTVTPHRGELTAEQVEQLLRPINPRRVLKDGKGKSHVSQQDITAHLIRVFGFGNFDLEVLNVELVFETPLDEKGAKWTVCYRALVRLTVRDQAGDIIAYHEDGSSATAQNQTRGAAHDLAYKSAISLSKKRCAINWGDQFGLSLYNKGQMTALVMDTMIGRSEKYAPKVEKATIEEGVEQQVSLGNDETDYDDGTHVDAQHYLDRATGAEEDK